MEHFSNDSEDHPKKHKNSQKLCNEMGHQKLCRKMKSVINGGKRSKTVSEVKPVEK